MNAREVKSDVSGYEGKGKRKSASVKFDTSDSVRRNLGAESVMEVSRHQRSPSGACVFTPCVDELVRRRTVQPLLTRGMVAQQGPPSLAVPSISASRTAPGAARVCSISFQVIPPVLIFALLVQHEPP